MVQALVGVPAGAAESDPAVVGAGRAGTHQREHGGGSQRCRPLKSLPPGRMSRECADDGVEAIESTIAPLVALWYPLPHHAVP